MVNGTVKLHDTHPLLYRGFLTFALVSVALGLNFFFFTPAFNPYEIPVEITGGVFLALGLIKLAVIYKFPTLLNIRLSMAACMGWMIFWGVSTIMSFPATSLQLPILYAAMVAFQMWHLLEPYKNPLTATLRNKRDA